MREKKSNRKRDVVESNNKIVSIKAKVMSGGRVRENQRIGINKLQYTINALEKEKKIERRKKKKARENSLFLNKQTWKYNINYMTRKQSG